MTLCDSKPLDNRFGSSIRVGHAYMDPLREVVEVKSVNLETGVRDDVMLRHFSLLFGYFRQCLPIEFFFGGLEKILEEKDFEVVRYPWITMIIICKDTVIFILHVH